MRIEAFVGQQIRAVRLGKELTQEELGERVEPLLGRSLSRQAVSQAEQGQRDFGIAELAAFALALEVSITGLLTPSDVEVVNLPGKNLTIPDMMVMLFGPSARGRRPKKSSTLPEDHPGRDLLERVSQTLRSALDAAEADLQSLDASVQYVEKLAKDGWGVAR